MGNEPRKTHCLRSAFVFFLGAVMMGPIVGAGQEPAKITQLRVSANRRYLVDQNNAPFLLQGDAAWSLIVAMSDAEVEQYLRNRRAKGFNTVIVELIEHRFAKHPPSNEAGDAPFTTLGDFSTPNEKYFEHADWVIRKAGEYGMVVMLVPIYLGYVGTDEGWIEEILKLEPEKCLAYGRYLGNRYKDFDNLIWVMGGDRNPETALERVDSIALGIRESDKRHLFTAHCHPENSAVERYGSGGWLSFNSTYTYEIVHEKLLADYNRNPAWPFILIETSYEGEHNASEVQIRRQAYWSVLCGGFGHVFGNNPIWHFNGPTLFPTNLTWQQALDLPGSVGMMHWGKLFRSRRWFDLVPDQKHEVVTAGLGEFRGLDYLAAGRTPDGGTVIAYMPSQRTITVDMSKMSGARARAWWFDPRTGKALAGGDYPTSGRRELTPPSEGDWVLVLDDASLNRLSPGSGS
ncbi:MAG: glycoside hydrolase family 140 protein [Terriglobia bacterium]|jgi:hypothetical protein